MHKTGCLICGADLLYIQNEKEMECALCKKPNLSNAHCKNGHFICDVCHESDAFDYIEKYCLQSEESDPAILANEIMKHPSIKMHGPEHHFLVPAVLLTSWYKQENQIEILEEKLSLAKKRSKQILGGFCGYYGSCGAGIGNGIFMSIMQEATPLSAEEWRLGNLLTARSLELIANQGGPRCCKRDSFTAIETAVEFLKQMIDKDIPPSKIECDFSDLNKECKLTDCQYYPSLN